MASDLGIVWGPSQALTWSLASLASDSALLAGRASAAVDLTAAPSGLSLAAYDWLLAGQVTTGGAPTNLTRFEVWVYGSLDDTPTYPDGLTGGDAAKAFSSRYVLGSLKNAETQVVTSTANRTYPFGPFSLRRLFEGALPKRVGLFCTHNTGSALHATAGNHAAWLTPFVHRLQ